jgi:hypothetical protein
VTQKETRKSLLIGLLEQETSLKHWDKVAVLAQWLGEFQTEGKDVSKDTDVAQEPVYTKGYCSYHGLFPEYHSICPHCINTTTGSSQK